MVEEAFGAVVNKELAPILVTDHPYTGIKVG
jgi:hypothetical protein